MKKALLFDMDGVLIDSENSWNTYGKQFLIRLFGKEILKHIIIGMTVDSEYELALKYGFRMPKQEYYERYDRQAARIYKKSTITPGITQLLSSLERQGFIFGIVSASRKKWIDMVVPRIPSYEKFSLLLSLGERTDLRPKPYPDGYIEAMKCLNVYPQSTFILEDSNLGIASAKAAGATVIGFRQHLLPGYQQKGADDYAETLEDVVKLFAS